MEVLVFRKAGMKSVASDIVYLSSKLVSKCSSIAEFLNMWCKEYLIVKDGSTTKQIYGNVQRVEIILGSKNVEDGNLIS